MGTGTGDPSRVAPPGRNVMYQSKIPEVSGAVSSDKCSDSHNGSFDQKRRRSGLDADA